MTNYRRAKIAGATYFFTVNCAQRKGNALLVEHSYLLRKVFRKVKSDHPFEINAMVVLPDHLHCIWTLPSGDADYKKRWALIKAGFSRQIPLGECRSESRMKRGERGVWQRRFWEHLIRDEQDYQRHVDYIHWNPVKHGWTEQVHEWRLSSFHTFVKKGLYPPDWGDEPKDLPVTGER